MYKLACLLLAVSLSGCITIDPLPPVTDSNPAASNQRSEPEFEPTYPQSEAEERGREERVAIATPESVNRLPQQRQQSAAAGLRSQARAAVADGDSEKAIRYLERALRIAPREAQTYYDFANVRLNQQRPDEALQLARRGLGMRPDLSLRNDLEQLVQLSTARLGR